MLRAHFFAFVIWGVAPAFAAEQPADEIWDCRSNNTFVPSGSDVILSATILNRTIGKIESGGTIRAAEFRRPGLDKRWDFDLQDDGTYNYSLVIAADGMGMYYDFSRMASGETVKPNLVFRCAIRSAGQ